MAVGVPLVDQRPHPIGPLRRFPIKVVFIAQVPSDIAEGRQARHSVAIVQFFLLTVRSVGRHQHLRGDERDDRDDHIFLARISEHALVALPVIHVEPAQIKARVFHVVRPLCHPGIQITATP